MALASHLGSVITYSNLIIELFLGEFLKQIEPSPVRLEAIRFLASGNSSRKGISEKRGARDEVDSTPTSLPDSVDSATTLNPRQSEKISSTETRPAVGKPTSAQASGTEGIASDNPETNQRQMTNPSPAANPGATQPRNPGEPAMNVSQLPGGVRSDPSEADKSSAPRRHDAGKDRESGN